MLTNSRNWSLGKKLIATEAILVFLLLSLFTYYVGAYCQKQLRKNYIEDMSRQVQLTKSMLEVYDRSVSKSTDNFENVFSSYFPGRFQLDTGRTIKIGTVDTPALLYGNKPLNLDFETIDRFTKMTGAVATVFARSGDDFIRITTSLKKQDGSRALGTTLGKNHPGYRLIMAGEGYLGRANLFGRDYSTKYVPIKGSDGQTIGILFIGFETSEALGFMKQQINAIKIGKTGFIYGLNAEDGEQQGTLVIHPRDEGQNVLKWKSTDGRDIVRYMIKSREGVVNFSLSNADKGETSGRSMLVVYTYFEKWKLVIAASAYEDEMNADIGRLRNNLIAANILIVLIIVGVLYFATRRMVIKPLQQAVSFAGEVAGGDLSRSLDIRGGDEIGMLGAALNKMVSDLKEMIGKIRDTSVQVAGTANQIAANSAQLTNAAHSQASAADETSSTMVQMAASIQTVAANAESLATSTDEVSASIQELGASSEQVARSAEIMVSSVADTSATIEQMTVSIEKVAQNTEVLSSSVLETSSTIEQMTVSIDHVSGNAQELREIVTESAAVIEQMATSVMEVAANVENADSVAKAASKEGAAGQQAVQDALTAMRKVAEVSGKTATSIMNLGKRSEEIGNIVKVIKEIADQTNLLALNAAIEAARAGDAGKGFAVVAEEVRKLAERSVAATREIAEVIKQVRADTDDSVAFGELAAREAQASMELSGIAGNSLANIITNIEQTSALMSDIARMTGEQAHATEQVIDAVEKMSRAADEVANAAREQAVGGRQIRLAVEKMNMITEEVSVSAREQAKGSSRIWTAIENMNTITGQVTIATREQSLTAQQIVGAVNSMSSMTQMVATATAEQKKGGEMVVSSADNISSLSRENLASVEQLARAAQCLSSQAGDLSDLVAEFKVN
jgi:methyl-accepting chemotaxis protein